MKINGKEIQKQGIETVVFPRTDGDLVFKAQPITSFEDFDKLCPAPKAPELLKPGGIRIEDVEHPEYKKALGIWAEKRSNWMLIQSLSATPGLTWDTVNLSDSETWKNFAEELTKCGLSAFELSKLFDIIITACGLTQSKIEEATKRFLAGPVAQ